MVGPDDVGPVGPEGGAASDPTIQMIMHHGQEADRLERELGEQPHDLFPHIAFLLAESYRQSVQTNKAIEAYRRRAEMDGGDPEERFVSLLQIARLMVHPLSAPRKDVTEAFTKANQERPWRAEPVYYLGKYVREQGDPEAARWLLYLAGRAPRPSGDSLFVEESIYEWQAKDEYARALCDLELWAEARQIYVELAELRIPSALAGHLEAIALCNRKDPSIALEKIRVPASDELSLVASPPSITFERRPIPGPEPPVGLPSKSWDRPLEDPFFLITSTAKNCVTAAKCIESVMRQGYARWQHVYVAADHATYVRASLAAKDERTTVIYSPLGCIENVYRVWQEERSPKTIVVWIDGDDWLAHAGALEILRDVYREHDPWLTYGDYRYTTLPAYGKAPHFGQRYSKDEPVRSSRWRVSHPKTFRLGLVKRVREESLKREDGSFLEYCSDRAFFIPMLEMAGERYQTLRDVLMVYNFEASFEVNGSAERKKLEEADCTRCHSGAPYEMLKERPF